MARGLRKHVTILEQEMAEPGLICASRSQYNCPFGTRAPASLLLPIAWLPIGEVLVARTAHPGWLMRECHLADCSSISRMTNPQRVSSKLSYRVWPHRRTKLPWV